MDLFEYINNNNLNNNKPLASRVRPTTLDQFIGQQQILNKNSLLYKAILSDRITSLILYGTSGTGKTTLAKIIAETTKCYFMQINGATGGSKDVKDVIKIAKNNTAMYNRKTILFIDEIHRFNKSQQDILLPYVEDGIIILIGATTENPYFEVNRALISRSIIFKLEPLKCNDIKLIITNAINNKEKGFGNLNILIQDDALDYISNICDGDARIALNSIELAVLSLCDFNNNNNNKIIINIDLIKECVQKRVIRYDKNADNHYDTISAFIKSMRGSDPDATVYYLAKMLYAGEDIKYIARRIIICASEDVGNADPRALQIAVSAFEACNIIGMPECRIILSQAACYVASAPKSNASYNAINYAMYDVENINTSGVPMHLREASYKGAKELGNGIDYKYAHDYKNNFVHQQYLPDELKNKVYYKPSENGYELTIKNRLKLLKKNKFK